MVGDDRTSLRRISGLATRVPHRRVLGAALDDEYWQGAPGEESPRRFLTMSSRLPLELQMVVCQRMQNSLKNAIVSTNSEPAFRREARFWQSGSDLADS